MFSTFCDDLKHVKGAVTILSIVAIFFIVVVSYDCSPINQADKTQKSTDSLILKYDSLETGRCLSQEAYRLKIKIRKIKPCKKNYGN